MGKFKDLTGMRFGRLSVLGMVDDYVGPTGKRRKRYRCRCDCGNEKFFIGENLSRGLTMSCGCLQKERAAEANTIHGETDSHLYGVWCAMKRRCNTPSVPEYELYGGRGIKICDEWMEFPPFQKWAYETGYDPDAKRGECTLDRKDVNGDYCPENCRWVNTEVQCNNKRNSKLYYFDGAYHNLSEWADITGADIRTLKQHIHNNIIDLDQVV